MARECKCPPYIIRCAHYEGDSLFLTDRSVSWGKHGPLFDDLPRYLCGADTQSPSRRISYNYEGDDQGAALAAFHEAEAMLLDRSTP